MFFSEGRSGSCTRKQQQQQKKNRFLDNTNAASLRDSWITPSLSFCPSLCALKCRQESQSCVLRYFLTLQSSAKGHGEKQRERRAEWKVSSEGKRKQSVKYEDVQSSDDEWEDIFAKFWRIEKQKDRDKQAEQSLDPVLGVVRWAAVAVERVAWSEALCWRVSHRREAVRFPLGSHYWKKEESSSCSGKERDSQTRGVRESVDNDSGPQSAWRWRGNGEITHRSMWNLIQASQGWQQAQPCSHLFSTRRNTLRQTKKNRDGWRPVQPL